MHDIPDIILRAEGYLAELRRQAQAGNLPRDFKLMVAGWSGPKVLLLESSEPTPAGRRKALRTIDDDLHRNPART